MDDQLQKAKDVIESFAPKPQPKNKELKQMKDNTIYIILRIVEVAAYVGGFALIASSSLKIAFGVMLMIFGALLIYLRTGKGL